MTGVDEPMFDGPSAPRSLQQNGGDVSGDGDLTDMLDELRVVLPSAQLLSAFLITVPFNSGFGRIVTTEKQVFLATFMLSIASLILLSARQCSIASSGRFGTGHASSASLRARSSPIRCTFPGAGPRH